MTALEQSRLEREIVEKFQQLPPDSQIRVLSQIQPAAATTHFDYARWYEDAAAFQDELRREHGADFIVPVQNILDEVREEASWLR